MHKIEDMLIVFAIQEIREFMHNEVRDTDQYDEADDKTILKAFLDYAEISRSERPDKP